MAVQVGVVVLVMEVVSEDVQALVQWPVLEIAWGHAGETVQECAVETAKDNARVL